MLTLPNVTTADAYTSLATLGPVATAQQIVFVVANAAVLAEIAPLLPNQTLGDWGDEILLTPQANVLQRAGGIRFRSAVAGKPAQVVAQLIEPADPVPGAGTPFTGTLSSSGSVTPGGGNIVVYPIASFPPASPADGDMAVVVTAVAGTRWLVQFNATTNSWDFLGGTDLLIPYTSPVTTGAWQELSSLVVPRPGIYDVGFTDAWSNGVAIASLHESGVSVNGAVPGVNSFLNDFYTGNRDASQGSIQQRLTFTAGQRASLMGIGPVGGQFFNAHGWARPVSIQ